MSSKELVKTHFFRIGHGVKLEGSMNYVTTQAALYTHHQYIAGFIMTGAFTHGAIFFIRDYNPEQNEDKGRAALPPANPAIFEHVFLIPFNRGLFNSCNS
ncbi:photosystem I P700 chlorophyll A apoprotein [Tanacetum coccineum]